MNPLHDRAETVKRPLMHAKRRERFGLVKGSAAPPTKPALGSAASVEVNDVSRLFRSKRGLVRALDHVTFDIPAGSFTALVGPSGCGKSTLLSLVGGLDRPTSGELKVDEESLSGPHPRLGVVFQRDLLLDWRTVLENVLFQIDMRGLKRSDYVDLSNELLELVGLQSFADRYPGELSGGMRQRVAICRALVHDPALLLMDEPFGALDAITREQLNTDLSRVCATSAKTVLFITHGVSEAVFLADQVVVMTPRPGRIAGIVDVTAGYPRMPEFRASKLYSEKINEVRSLLHEQGVL